MRVDGGYFRKDRIFWRALPINQSVPAIRKVLVLRLVTNR
jgi:hypothetical protein